MLLARAKRAKLVFNVSDLWPESAVQLGLVTNPMLIRMSTWLEMKCYRRASLITGQTQGIVDDIKLRCPDQNIMWLPNGVDFDAIAAANDAPIMDPRSKLGIGVDDPVVAYAGIIGHAQGLDVVLNAAVLLRERTNIHFLLIGDGPEKAMLLEMKTKLDPINVRFIDRMPRAELLSLMRSIDAVVVPLRKNDLFKGAIPSKIFEALALGKPLLLGVEGEAKRLFVDDAGAGLAYDPENAHSLAGAVRRVCDDRATAHEMGARGREYVRAHFDRDVLTERLWVELQAMTTAGR